MPPSFKQRARNLFSRFRPVEHIPTSLSSNVHDLSRIGGISILILPTNYTPCDLIIPTRFAATAQFLIDAGLETPRPSLHEQHTDGPGMTFEDDSGLDLPRRYVTMRRSIINMKPHERVKVALPGLFRIPGQRNTVDRLRAYFDRQLYDGGGSVSTVKRPSMNIEFTIRLPLLPNSNVLPYQIHDIASCFKSFLADLQGGILGELSVFEGLRKVVMPARGPRLSSESADLEWRCVGTTQRDHDDEPVNVRLVARILRDIECSAARNLILAVFGLLAFLMVDEDAADQNHSPGIPELEALTKSCFSPTTPTESRMTAEALGRIFAPLMLSEEAVKLIRLDLAPPMIFRKDKTRKRQSWSPLKSPTTTSPTRRTFIAGKTVRQRRSMASSITNLHINILPHPHPHPLRSSPYLPLHEAAGTLDYDVINPPHSAPLPNSVRGRAFHHYNDEDSGTSNRFKHGQPNISMPNLTSFSLANRRGYQSLIDKSLENQRPTSKGSAHLRPSSATKKEDKDENKTTAMLHDQNARMLLIANVITLLLQNWRGVVEELKTMGYGGCIAKDSYC